MRNARGRGRQSTPGCIGETFESEKRPRMKKILVTGDPICDHNYYKGRRPTADSEETRGFRYYRTGGGALLLKDLIAATMEEGKGDQGWVTEFGLDPDFESLPLKYHSYCIWEPTAGAEGTEYWRAIEPPLGYGHPDEAPPAAGCPKPRSDAYIPPPEPPAGRPDIVVIDDAGIGFRDPSRRSLWSFTNKNGKKTGPDWVVYKLTGPLGRNGLWDEVADRYGDKLVVIVPAEELRRRDVRLSRGLSWEATAEDLAAELRNDPKLKPILRARHLVVTFQSDGAFWHDNNPEGARSLLVFDASRAEGEWSESQGKGGAFGYLSCLTAAVVRELCLWPDKSDEKKDTPDFEAALEAGLGASRELRRIGHGEVVVDGQEPGPGFPRDSIVERIRQPRERFVSALVPQYDPDRRGSWNMLDEWQVEARGADKQRPHYEAALAVGVLGLDALERFPVARFGKYQTVDRNEIESLRTIRQLIKNYCAEERPDNPLNLGVFGPPGSGKSYIVYQIAEAVGKGKDDVLLFNLSQFKDANDICGAFHQVRDRVLQGSTPFVFWDEFDSQGYRWLQYLLAPMEDGEFQDGQITHPLGKCIFVFAGATSPTFEKFGPVNPARIGEEGLKNLAAKDPELLREVEKAWREFVLAKGPDFKSRVVSYINLLGMNQRQVCDEKDGRRRWVDDPEDRCFPIRRALFLRSLLKLKEGERLKLDLSVVRALLEIPVYKGAGRSLQFLCGNLRRSGSGSLNRSAMPGYELLNMHVDATEFWDLCERDNRLLPLAEALAPDLHRDWRTYPENEGSDADKPWDELTDSQRNSNVQQALRIITNLALVGLRIEKGRGLSPSQEKEIRGHIDRNIETMAEAEHNGWMVERMIDGWRYGKVRVNERKLHPLLLPYSQLPEAQKDKDRFPIRGRRPDERQKRTGEKAVHGYVDRLKQAGYRILFMDDAQRMPQ